VSNELLNAYDVSARPLRDAQSTMLTVVGSDVGLQTISIIRDKKEHQLAVTPCKMGSVLFTVSISDEPRLFLVDVYGMILSHHYVIPEMLCWN
jgi:hypothetical protein